MATVQSLFDSQRSSGRRLETATGRKLTRLLIAPDITRISSIDLLNIIPINYELIVVIYTIKNYTIAPKKSMVS